MPEIRRLKKIGGGGVSPWVFFLLRHPLHLDAILQWQIRVGFFVVGISEPPKYVNVILVVTICIGEGLLTIKRTGVLMYYLFPFPNSANGYLLV